MAEQPSEQKLAFGVDLGGTKLIAGIVDNSGAVLKTEGCTTRVNEGYLSIKDDIVKAIQKLRQHTKLPVIGLGVGMAGQIDHKTGYVHFAPNLKWHEVPLQQDLIKELEMPVVVTNDVRAATWGEWIHGAGKGSEDLICLFVGTGIGGGVVSGGRMLTGFTNCAGEIGHMPISFDGPQCSCGNRGCFEAHASGWAIAKKAQKAVEADPQGLGHSILELASGNTESISAKIVFEASLKGDPLAKSIVDEMIKALIVGSVGIVNAFNPERLIIGGGVLKGYADLEERVEAGIRERALETATKSLKVLRSELKERAGMIGAATLAMQTFEIKD